MPNVELGHVDGRYSFESILMKYKFNDQALHLLGRIVHGADVPEAEDHLKLSLESPMCDALYVWCQHRVES